MIFDLKIYFLLFLIYSFVGWVLEVIYTLFTDKKLTNRGFFIGPYCPIYGVGALLIVIFLSKFQQHPFALFILAVVICSVLEYCTSYVMEKIFKIRWWDYSNNKFNINGRICLETMIPFGVIACLLVYVINPFLVLNLNKLSESCLVVLSLVFGVLLLADFIASFNIINNFKKTVKNVSERDRTEDINKYVKNLWLKKSFLYRRLIKAFPKIETKLKTMKKNFEDKNKKD